MQLQKGGHEIPLADWGAQLLQAFVPVAAALDSAHGSSDYSAALAASGNGLAHPDSLPSARVLAAMVENHDSSFVGFARAQSVKARAALLNLPFDADTETRFAAMAKASIDEQKQIEAADTMPFESYRQQYVSPDRLGLPTLANTV